MKFCLLWNLYLVNINASAASFEIPTIFSKDIEQKPNSKINQGLQK